MLGLRLRLKSRPSLLDLIARHQIDETQLVPPPRAPSLHHEEVGPIIPHSASLDNSKKDPRASSTLPDTSSLPPIHTMAPSRKAQEAEEDEYGAVFSVSGPVIVAENMIGCAMYELVG
jgi:hypothetical protein